MRQIEIRRACVEDAEDIAKIHIAAWRESYGALMPAATLATLDCDEWAASWRKKLAGDGDRASAVFLAGDETGAPSGFAHCGRQRSEKLLPLGFSGEFASLYLLSRIQRRGVGRRLLSEMACHLLAHGCESAAVWVFRDAVHARAFYRAQGAEPTGVAGQWEIYGMALPDMAYGRRDLAALAAARRES